MQKLLASCGVASRRRAEELIALGRVTVNGAVAKPGDRASLEADEILVEGKAVAPPAARTYLMLNKPRGYVSTLSDEKGRRTVAQLVEGCGARVFPVGRLDLSSEGLLLMTDDGALAQRLAHPSHEVEKEYVAWVTGGVDAALPMLRGRLTLDGKLLAPALVHIKYADAQGGVLTVVIREGKNRQVRRMCELAGLHVTRLRRVREGPLRLEDLPAGSWRRLTEAEVNALLGKESSKTCKL
ncbi:MAG TPA: pseudouridine synthase [Oscillospiraceae bacterium]|nr:pseudouridine synthase [Oscillospiraceae bacterium]